MTQNDIEQLLEQYGSDQRQQRHAAEHVRHLARRQARRRTALACVAVMVAIVGVVTHRWQQLPETTGVLVAEQPTATVPHTTTMPPTITPNTTPDAVPATTLRTVEAHPTTPSSDLSEYSEPAEPAVFSEPSEFSESPKNPESPTPSLPPLLPLSSYYNQDNPTHSPMEVPSRSRLHITASVGASTLSGTSFGMNNNLSLAGINDEPTTNFCSITPTNAFSANVGVAYTVASYSRSHLDVGVTLSGYSQQGNLHIHDEQQLYVEAMLSDGFASSGENNIVIVPNNTDEYYTFNTLSLYAGVPLSLNLHPRGYNKTGWQLSLTPAYNLATTRHIGSLSATTPNPWKLTVGIGIALPNSVIRRISLTANLLPLYPSQSLHEYGLEIGI